MLLVLVQQLKQSKLTAAQYTRRMGRSLLSSQVSCQSKLHDLCACENWIVMFQMFSYHTSVVEVNTLPLLLFGVGSTILKVPNVSHS